MTQPEYWAPEPVESPQPAEVPGGWPAGFSEEPTMKIGEVLAILHVDFPAVSASRLRYYDNFNILVPKRGANGYRAYSAKDVERLRYLLTEQRDRYTPLKVIAEQLAELDAGLAEHEPTRTKVLPRRERQFDVESLAQQVGCDTEFIVALIEAGLLREPHGYFDPWAVEVASAAFALTEFGIDPRHLRTFRLAADRQVDLVDKVVAPLRSRRDSRGRVEAQALDMSEVCLRLHSALVRSSIADLR